jgi:hypothetical protein
VGSHWRRHGCQREQPQGCDTGSQHTRPHRPTAAGHPPVAIVQVLNCHGYRPLPDSLARSSSASLNQLRFDLLGAIPKSEGARLPSSGASCVPAVSSLAKRKTTRTAQRMSQGSQAPVDHAMGHMRSRRPSQCIADDLRPEDTESGVSFPASCPHTQPTRRDRTSNIEADCNSIKFYVTNHTATTNDVNSQSNPTPSLV